MEKIIVTLRTAPPDETWCAGLLSVVADDLLGLGLSGVTINVRDAVVSDSLMTLTTLDPPVVALISLWSAQYYGTEVRAALDRLTQLEARVDAYLVTESVPLPPPASGPGERARGFANVALLRRPAELPVQTWLDRWHLAHTAVAIDTQSTFGYVQNTVVRALTPEAAPVDAIVEELFPLEALTDLHAFFDAADDGELTDRMTRMVASTSAFGANENVDTVPTSRYVFRTPFAEVRA